jgi:hypothetical protein
MPTYSVYGSVMESALEFPELTPRPSATPRWRLSMVPELFPMLEPVAVGDELIYGECHARLFRHRDGHRIVVDDTGSFEIESGGHIIAAPKDGAFPDFVRAHLLGRVLATALFHEGMLPLHGSAVQTREGVVAFLAPKFYGKSSTALAMVKAGAPLVSDDLLPIEPSLPPRAWPGIRSLRVREDSVRALGVEATGDATREGKVALHGNVGAMAPDTPLPLAAIFLLAPTTEPLGDDVARRTPLSPTLAAAALVAHVKIGRMIGPTAAATMLERAATVARLVPVHQLVIARDLARLPEAAAQVLTWYGGPATR